MTGLRSLRSKKVACRLLGLRVRISSRAWIFVCLFVVFCAGSCLCEELITLLEESYRVCFYNCLWCTNLNSEAESAQLGLFRKGKESLIFLSWRRTRFWLQIWFVCLFVFGATAPSGPWPLHSRGFLITHNDAPQSVGLLWKNDQLVAENSTWQHTTLTTDKYPRPRWDSNPQSQQASGRRSTP